MTQPFTLTQEQRDQFDRLGVVRLDGVYSPGAVQRAREVVLSRLAATGVWQDGGWRLDALPGRLKNPSKVIGNRHPEVEALIEDASLCVAIDELMEGRAWLRIGPNRRPHMLFTLPSNETWRLPSGWHCDVPRLASGEAPGVQVFTFLETVEPRGGGTLVVAGSHRLMQEGRHIRPQAFPFHLRGEPFFDELFAATTTVADGAPLPAAVVRGVPLQVMELTGQPGDAWLLDLRVLHTTAPNAGVRPRVMVTYRYVRRDLSAEIAEAWGWAVK